MASKKTNSSYPDRRFRRDAPAPDQLLPVKNVVIGPNNTIQPPSYADRAYQLCSSADSNECYKKVDGWVVDIRTPRMLGKAYYQKDDFISPNQISSTPGYLSRNVDSGRNLKRKKD